MKVRHNTYVSSLIMVENPNEGHTVKFGIIIHEVISILYLDCRFYEVPLFESVMIQ